MISVYKYKYFGYSTAIPNTLAATQTQVTIYWRNNLNKKIGWNTNDVFLKALLHGW